jgi:anti-anti-sigma regulatory factor
VLRITSVTSPGEARVLRVEGRIAEQWVDELSRVALAPQTDSGGLVLDLSGVTFVDQRGVALLRRLRCLGVELVEGSAFVQGLLKESVE